MGTVPKVRVVRWRRKRRRRLQQRDQRRRCLQNCRTGKFAKLGQWSAVVQVVVERGVLSGSLFSRVIRLALIQITAA